MQVLSHLSAAGGVQLDEDPASGYQKEPIAAQWLVPAAQASPGALAFAQRDGS
jgi:hypothetical protein